MKAKEIFRKIHSMEHFPKSFQKKDASTQKKIIELGLYCWSLIEHEVDSQKDMDQADLISIWKEKGRQEGKELAEVEYSHALQKKELKIQSLEFEKEIIETRMNEVYNQEKQLLISKTRLEVEKENKDIQEEKIRLETKLKTQDDFQSMCMSLLAENNSMKEQIQKLTKTKSSAQIGNDGEDEIEFLLGKSGYEFDKQAKEKGGHKADFRIKTPTDKIFLLDSKKYTTNVSKKEKEKLSSDVDRDETVSGGIFVSITSGIANQTHGDISVTKHYKPILFLSLQGMTQEAKEHTMKLAIKLLEKYTSLHEEKEKTDLLEKVKKAIQTLSELVSRFKNIEKWADEMKQNAKIGVTETELLLSFLQVM
jgi:hypothetical protein